MNTDKQESSGRKSYLKKIGLLLLTLLLVVFFLGAGVTYFVFSSWQEIPASVPQFADLATQYRLVQQVSRIKTDKSGKLPEKMTLKLSPREINSLFKLAANVTLDKSPYPVRYYRPAISEQGVFSAVYPVNTGVKLLWGGTIYVKVTFTLSKEPGADLQCKINSLKVTSLPLSSSIAQKVLDTMKKDEKIQKDLKRLNNLLHSVSFVDGKFVIEFNPQQLLQFIN